MCGRFTLQSPADLLASLFQVPDLEELRPRYNIAPTQEVLVVRVDPDEGSREALMMRWGLVPFFAKDISIGTRMINARSETLAEKPSFRAAYKSRRCLVAADGYYEWKSEGKVKQPYRVTQADGGPFAMAGLFERWKNPEGGVLHSCTVITTAPAPSIDWLHDRMPVILEPQDWDLWLDPGLKDKELLQPLLAPWEGAELVVRSVSRRVGQVREDDADLITPIDLNLG